MTEDERKAFQAQQHAKMMQKEEYFRGLTYDVFKKGTPGEKWLDLVRESFVFRLPVADPSKDANSAFFREGANSFIRNIYTTLEAHEAKMKQNNAGGEV